MAPSLTFLLAIASACIVQVHSAGYYWRDFDGTIPEDAVSAGYDEKDKQYFVGQAFGIREDKWAVAPVGLTEGQTNYSIQILNVDAPKFAKITYDLRVLCSTRKNNFQWVSTNYLELDKVMNIVRGGWANEGTALTPLYIGRISKFGYPSVGRIQSENDYHRNYVRYVHDDTPYHSNVYDVLTYEE